MSVCLETKTVCDSCVEKGYTNIHPSLRPCAYCLKNDIKCVKAAVLCIAQDSESRNAGAQKLLMKEREKESDPFLATCSVVPDAVHVAKRKRQSFANWWLLIKEERKNLEQLRQLRNDPILHSKMSPLLPVSAVRNRDRQDVESVLQISSPKVQEVLHENVSYITHTIIPEPFRVTEDNKVGILNNLLVCVSVHLAIYLSVTLKVVKYLKSERVIIQLMLKLSWIRCTVHLE